MQLKLVLYGVVVLLVAAVIGSAYLFWVQNGNHTVLTSFELWGLGRYGRTWKVTELIAVSGGIGFLVGVLPFAWLWLRRGAEVRRLRQQVAIGGGSSGSDSSFR